MTGVRSSWPTRPISCWRRAARSRRASWATSSWRARRRSRSRASVSSSITLGVTASDRTAPPSAALRIAWTISSPSASFSTYPEAPATSMSRTARCSSRPVRATTRARDGRLETPGGLDAVHLGHPDVHQHHVGRQCPDQVDRLRTGGGLPDDLEVPAVEQGGQRFAEPVVVVHDDESVVAVHGRTGGAPDRLHARRMVPSGARAYRPPSGFNEGTRCAGRWLPRTSHPGRVASAAG